jgi:hypothetical protein
MAGQQLRELVDQVTAFDTAGAKEQIKLIAWWLHVHDGRELFGPAEVRACYARLHLDEPPALATYLTRMAEARPADLLKEKGKYKLARQARVDLDKKYGVHTSIVAVSKLLSELPDKIPNVNERAFLSEALKCYKVEAYRACIVMTWNLAYGHLLDWILREQTRLDRFNIAISKRYQKMTTLKITKYDEFLDGLKESQVIEICNTASLFNSNVFKILKEKLDKRNIAAHPSSVVVVQSQADDVVTDLINNVVLALS